MEIEKIVKAINFDPLDDDMFGETFTKKQIIKGFSYESIIPDPIKILPETYVWYLENYGSRTVRNMEFQVHIDDNTMYVVSFDGLVAPQSTWQQYRYQTCTGSYDYRLEDIEANDFILDQKFLPITNESQGKMLVMDIKEDLGSIWQFPSEEDCKTYDLVYQPSFVAKNLTEFLKLLKPIYSFKNTLTEKGYKEIEECSNVWKKNIQTAKELFYNCIDEYEKDSSPNFKEFKNVHEFLNTLASNPEKITINEPRAVELFYLSFGGS